MTVVLPDDGGGRVEKAVAGGGLRDILMAPEPQAVQLLLPKWTFTSGSALKQVADRRSGCQRPSTRTPPTSRR